MAEQARFPRRVFIADQRQGGKFLRVTWHAEQATFVVSHWEDDVCVAATRVAAADAATLVALFAQGMGDALTRAPVAVASVSPPLRRSRLRVLWQRLYSRPRLAEVIALHRPRGVEEQRRRSNDT